MKRPSLRRFFYRLRWYLPLAVLPILLVCAVAVWTVTTPMGSRLLLHAGGRLAGVQVQAVSGTLWRGVQVGQLVWVAPSRSPDSPDSSDSHEGIPGLSLHAQDVAVRLDWQRWLAGLRSAWRSGGARGVALEAALLQWQVPQLHARSVRLQGTALEGLLERGGKWTAQDLTVPDWVAYDIRASLALDARGGVLALHQARWQDVAARMTVSAKWQERAAHMALAANGPDVTADLALSANWQDMTAHMTLAASGPDVAADLVLTAQWPDRGRTARLSLQANTAPPTRWQEQGVQASVAANIYLPMQHIVQGAQDKPAAAPPPAPWWQAVVVDDLALDVRLTQTDAAARPTPSATPSSAPSKTPPHLPPPPPPQTLRVQGRLGSDDTRLEVAANMGDLAAWWPDWRGSIQGKGQLASSDAQRWHIRLHALSLEADTARVALQTPLMARVELNGRWIENLTESPPIPASMQWRADAFAARLTLPDIRVEDVPDPLSLTLHHQASSGHLDADGQAVLHAQGEMDTPFSLLPVDLATVLPARRSQFELNARWLPQAGYEKQGAEKQGVEPPQLRLEATVQHEGLGQVRASATYRLDGQDEQDGQDGTGEKKTPQSAPLVWQAQVDIPDLHWLDRLAGETVELGGRLQAQLQGRGGQKEGDWAMSGTVSGEQIRVLRLDDGVRLLDGSLRARLDNKRLVLERLRFAAVPRVRPRHAGLAAWLQDGQADQPHDQSHDQPQIRDGWLDLSGSWDLGGQERSGQENNGKESHHHGLNITLHRYPVLQRVDRYAMVSGSLLLALPPQPAAAPAAKQTPVRTLALSGKVQVDAGWLDLEALTRVPTLDSDVVILRGNEGALAPPGQENTQGPGQTPGMDFSMALQLDLGPRFYLTGYGMDTALVGELALALPARAERLTAQGVLHPRGGTVSAYGQTLQLREDSRITFATDIANPLLHVEAVRGGQAIQAGVRVSGTPRRPRVTLISYPEVNDTEKLSWLLFGRGPDESGGDAALLLSVGSSFLLDGGEPFYRRFGVDELGMRSGSLGSVGSVLPVESVVQGFASGTSEIERKFVVASTRLTERVSASVEQALSDNGTVGRLAWRLGRGVSAQLAVGTVNGLALIYHLVLDD